jgi:hypothetical protein
VADDTDPGGLTRPQRYIEEASELMEESLTLDRDPATGSAAFNLTLPAEAVAGMHVGGGR